MVSLAAAWQEGRKARATRPPRRPIVFRLTALAARVLPTWKRVRTVALTATGFGFVDFAAWSWHHIAGYLAIGVSLLVMEALGGDR